MADSHYPVTRIEFAPGSLLRNAVLALARWSRNPTGRAVVFVHGYGGDASTTWPRFNSLLPDDPRFAGVDVIFYQYDAVYRQIGASAGLFRDFLRQLITSAGEVVNHATDGLDLRSPDFEYERIVLAGHSTGAVVIRRTLLDALRDASDRAIFTSAPIRLVFFAPAHRGAIVSRLVANTALGQSWILAPAALAAQITSPVLSELDPTQPTLQRLEAETHTALASSGPRHLLVAEDVIHGADDRVVYIDRFCEDPHPKPLLKETHTSVCKPGIETETKYDRLARLL